MDLASMRDKFLERTANLASAYSDEDVNAFLSKIYRYAIAAEIPGQLTEGEWNFNTVASTDTYDYDDEVYEVRAGARIGTNWLNSYFRKDQFQWDHSSTSSEQRPYAVLFYGRQATLYPTPDVVYTVTTPARLYPSSDLTSAGLANHNHAMAVICEAAREFLTDVHQKEHAADQEVDLQRYLSRLRGQSLSRVRERRRRLSF